MVRLKLAPDRAGLVAGILSAALFSTMALFVRVAKADFSTGQLIFARAVIGILVFSWVCRKELPSLISVGARPLWLRAFFGGGSVACYFINLRDIPLGIATVLTDLAPVFVALFSIVFFHEKPNWKTVSGVLLAVAGVASMSAPGATTSSFSGIAIGVLGALLGAWAYLSLKAASGKYSSSTVVLAFSIALLFVAFLDSPPLFKVKESANFLPVIGVVITSLAAQILLTISYRALSATAAATLGLTAVLWALLFDLIFLGASISWTALGATTLILLGVRLTHSKPNLSKAIKPEPPAIKAVNE